MKTFKLLLVISTFCSAKMILAQKNFSSYNSRFQCKR